MKTNNKILNYYEDFNKIVGEFDDEHIKFEYKAPSSLHSGIISFGYGEILSQSYVNIVKEGALSVKLVVDKKEFDQRRFYLKIILCLVEWKKWFNDLKIYINGKLFHTNDREFIENVHVGSPSLYFELDQSFLCVGKNIVKIETQNSNQAGLYLSAVDFVTLPKIELFSQISYLKFARAGQRYAIALQKEGNRVTQYERSRRKSARIHLDIQYGQR